MAIIVARPSEPRQEHAPPGVAFLTHYNYLMALHLIIRERYTEGRDRRHPDVLTGVAAAVTEYLDGRHVATRGRSERAEHILGMAWATEAALNIGLDDEITPIANNWSVVQAYYACYQCFQAMLVATGQPEIESHMKASRVFTSIWVKNGCDLPPWSMAYGSSGALNFPDGITLPPARSIHTPDDDTCWTHYERCLRRTREDWVRERMDAAREERRKTAGERAKLRHSQIEEIERSIRPANFLDYLYRLRHRSNYEDARMFVEGPVELPDSVRFNRRLRQLVSATMLAHELRLARAMGAAVLRRAAHNWSARLGSDREYGIHMRRHYL